METDECLDNNGGCWRDEKTNVTACKVPVPSIPQQVLSSAESTSVGNCLLTDRVPGSGHLQREDLRVPCGGWHSVPRGRVHRLQRYHQCPSFLVQSFSSGTESGRISDLTFTASPAVGPARCAMDNGGCWTETRGGKTFSACSVIR
jgi:hypothetical protein